MLTNIKACLFDLDGTVVDSMWVWGSIDRDYLKRFGINEVPKNMQKDIEGLSIKEVAKYFKAKFGIEDALDKIINDWNDMALYRYSHDVPAKPHILQLLIYLKENGIKIGLCTSNSLLLAKAVLENLKLLDYFDEITAGCSDVKGKPEPDIYLITAEKLSVKPTECIVFEDLVKGIMAGKNAGMKTCAVWDEYSDYQLDEKLQLADYYIKDYAEILKNLQG